MGICHAHACAGDALTCAPLVSSTLSASRSNSRRDENANRLDRIGLQLFTEVDRRLLLHCQYLYHSSFLSTYCVSLCAISTSTRTPDAARRRIFFISDPRYVDEQQLVLSSLAPPPPSLGRRPPLSPS
ncbi:uncharacterized protein RHOBADRAFT_47784 [Rhodotorula graminis WP1]|uniref:Uncharacterized protein n=1 Tax=Rhodotorula graminis (strain WP1) TaxID=578459 RepID=A0A0P9EWG6_RHOGW|nr:uncharacterized protein RHOBADRAFT_47784 [Rhodotorula graminis WP1]KPV71439.1 hypothetical protein RHOBADRAFT_47784 [Rhodotorula graminis WP1]